ncbi:YggT family protein [Actinoplanes sp. TBRC 11911]|uniref:YggT family protein n=1 Tax=Actinoplanes sp. TBRC 11911 TaxID=2729386 RepID=UPI00145F0D94|nr:YggT family protein [Actinoplanes sp. TBRC 11911]NMO53270.1 YggT family protein [Actinoplanes sp. TBRC 11911]
MGPLLALVSFGLLLFQLLLVVRAILSWSVALVGPSSSGSFRARLTAGVTAITEPVIRPVRRVIPPLRLGGTSIDLAYIVVFFVIVLLRNII